MTQKALNTWSVGFMAGDDHPFLVDAKGNTRDSMSPELTKILTTQRHDWKITLLALGIDSFGDLYHKRRDLGISSPLTHEELLETLNEKHKTLCESMNPNQFIRPAWVISAGDKDPMWNDIFLIDLFESRGGFVR